MGFWWYIKHKSGGPYSSGLDYMEYTHILSGTYVPSNPIIFW